MHTQLIRYLTLFVITWLCVTYGQAQSRVGGGDDKTINVNKFPLQPYAMADISRSSVSDDVSYVALDDLGNAAFATVVDNHSTGQLVTVKRFFAGHIEDAGQFDTAYTKDLGYNWNYLGLYYLRPNGEWLGYMDIDSFTTTSGDGVSPDPDDPAIDNNYIQYYHSTYRGGFIASERTVTQLRSYPYVVNVTDTVALSRMQMGGFMAGSNKGFCFWEFYSEIDIPPQSPYILWPNGPYGSPPYNGYGHVAEVASDHKTVFFDISTPENILDVSGPTESIIYVRKELFTNGSSYGSALELNDIGSIIYTTGDKWWNGQQILSTGLVSNSLSFWGLTNENRMIGQLDYNDPNTGYLWENGNYQLLSQILVGSPWEGQITNIIPLLISNEDPVSHGFSLVTAVKDGGVNKLLLWRSVQPPAPVGGVLPNRRWAWSEVQLPDDLDVTWENLEVINSNGVIAAITDNHHAVLILPLELTDNKETPTLDDDIVINPMGPLPSSPAQIDNYWKSANDSNVALIVPHQSNSDIPLMPQLEASFLGAPNGLKVKWKLNCHYDRGNGLRKNLNQSADTVLIDRALTPLPVSQAWQMYAENEWKSDFFGGECELSYQIVDVDGNPVGEENISRFIIGGLSPHMDKARTYIDVNAVPKINHSLWFSYAIAKQESAYKDDVQHYYNHFYTRFRSRRYQNGQPWRGWWPRFPTFGDDQQDDGMPNGPGGYGLFQITQDDVPRKDLWNWQDNAYDTITEVNKWRSEAESWYQAALRTWGTPPGAWIPPTPSNEPALTSNKGLSAIDAENIVLYNGPKGLGEGRNVKLLGDDGKLKIFRASIWTYNAKGWHFHDNVNHYVYFVTQHIDPDSSN